MKQCLQSMNLVSLEEVDFSQGTLASMLIPRYQIYFWCQESPLHNLRSKTVNGKKVDGREESFKLGWPLQASPTVTIQLSAEMSLMKNSNERVHILEEELA
jgi:hypothetical protein